MLSPIEHMRVALNTSKHTDELLHNGLSILVELDRFRELLCKFLRYAGHGTPANMCHCDAIPHMTGDVHSTLAASA